MICPCSTSERAGSSPGNVVGLPEQAFQQQRAAGIGTAAGRMPITCLRSYSPGVSAGGSQGPVVNSSWRAWSLSMPHLVVVSR